MVKAPIIRYVVFTFPELLPNCTVVHASTRRTIGFALLWLAQVKAAVEVLKQWPTSDTFSKYTNFDRLGFYDRWIMALYCEELTAKFGSFAIVDPALIPVGMLQVFRGTKVRWEQ